VKLTVTRSDGKSIILRIAEEGELIGLDCIVSGKTFTMTAESLGPCSLRFIPRELLRGLMRDHHDVCMAVAEQLGADYRSACSQIRSLGLSRTASERIVLFLLDWGSRGRQTDNGLRVNIPLKHEEIAQIVGVSRETVTRTFTELKHKQLIAMKGPAVLIRNKSALEALTAR
jgi:CRP/FNR family transcriptional regulator